jgi:hypothetical protein
LTLGVETIHVKLTVPNGTSTWEVGIFDGDTGKDATGAVNPNNGHWDVNDAGTADLTYALYADPAGDGSHTGGLIGAFSGNNANPVTGALYTASAATMPDNDWWNLDVTTTSAAQAAHKDPFIYDLVITMNQAGLDTGAESSFKLRTNGSLSILPGVIGFIGSMRVSPNDFKTIYPNFPNSLSPTTYDGHWSFSFQVPANQTQLDIWDGDWDVAQDTDDPDSPRFPTFPQGAGGNVLPQGANPGNPPDDNIFPIFVRTPSVVYRVVDPSGKAYRNDNPSGNSEWERFRITTNPDSYRNANPPGSDDPLAADYGPNVSSDGVTFVTGTTLPAGIWSLEVFGLDLDNICFLRLPFEIVASSCTQPSAITANFNGTDIPAGSTLWFNSVLSPTGLSTTNPTSIFVTDASIQFTANGTNYNVDVPDSTIIYSPTATLATTTFDPGTNTWTTVIPLSVAGKNAFMQGVAFPVPAGGLPGGIKGVTWTGQFSTNLPGVNVQWQWAAAVYTQFSTNHAALGVKPTDDNQASQYKNSDHAGTPENFKPFVTGGATGGGGSNFTGSYTSTASVAPCP